MLPLNRIKQYIKIILISLFGEKKMEKIDKSDVLKTYNQILIPDSRLLFWGNLDKNLAMFHAKISNVNLHDDVPLGVRVQFETAKNVLLYSFYAYRMSTVARSYAYSVFERALTEKIVCDLKLENVKGLKRKLQIALEKKWISKNDFFLIPNLEKTRDQETLDFVYDYFVTRRNELLHEPKELGILWDGPDDLVIFANLINKIWIKKAPC